MFNINTLKQVVPLLLATHQPNNGTWQMWGVGNENGLQMK